MSTTVMNSNEQSVILLFIFTIGILGLVSPITAQTQERTVTLELALKPASQTLRVGQSLEYTVHLANPNEEMVTLPHIPPLASLGVELRSDQGYLEGRFKHDVWISQEPRLDIPADGEVIGYALLHKYFSLTRWPEKPGEYEIRMAGFPTRATIGPNAESVIIEWVRPSVKITALPLDAHHEAALDYLKREEERINKALPDVRRELDFINMCESFLARYSPSDYDREIRAELAVRTTDFLDDGAKFKSIPPPDQERLAALWNVSVIACLNAGPPYNEEFLDWKEPSGSSILELAVKYRRPEVIKALCREFDKRMPEDREGRLLRGIILEGMTGSMEKAESQAAAYKTEFPDGKYTRSIDGFLRLLKQ